MAIRDAGGALRGTLVLLSRASRRPRGRGERGHRGGPWRGDEFARLLRLREGEVGDRLRRAVAGGRYLGTLAAGDRLPGMRETAAAAGVPLRAVSAAYQGLGSEGTLELHNRTGTVVATPPEPGVDPECETGEWLARALAEAVALQVKVPLVPELARRWTATVPVVCACVETCEDDLVALEEDVARYWGMEPVRVRADAGPRALADALRGADVIVTTPFHAAAARQAAPRKPVVVAALAPRIVRAAAERLRQGPLTAVVVDEEYGTRLRGLEGGERLRIVLARDAAALARIAPDEPVLMTRAARQRVTVRPRLLVAPTCFLVPEHPMALARIIVHRNRAAEREVA
jgi:DNA-binding transcriptional regulator YhcF (GntR family)